MQFNHHCSICTHPQRQAIHDDRLVQHLTVAQLGEKYFPGRNLRATKKAVQSHFKKHCNMEEETKIATALVLAGAATDTNAPITPGEERIFAIALRERIEAVQAMEHMLRTLMARANEIEAEYQRVMESPGRCEHCKRGMELIDYMADARNLDRLLKVFKEIREQLGDWMELKNPAIVIQKMAERTFVTFVRAMTDVYVHVQTDRHRLIKEAVNEYVAGNITGPVFLEKMSSLDDFGVSKIAAEAETQFNRIMGTMLKELR